MTLFRSLFGILLVLLLWIDADYAYPSRIPLEVDYSGCKSLLLPGPVCVLEKERTLSLWIRAPAEASIEIHAERQWRKTDGKPVQDGQQFSLTIPLSARKVDVLVEGAEGRAAWSLALAESESSVSQNIQSEADEIFDDIYEEIQSRRLAEARKKLQDLRLPPKGPAELRCQQSYYRGLLAEKEGDYRTALTEIQNASSIAERTQVTGFQWLVDEKLAGLLSGVGRFREASQLFDRLSQAPQFQDSCEEAQFLGNWAWSALLAREAGERLGDPTPLLERAFETYDACKDVTPEKKANVLINLALAHLQENRLAVAKDYLTRVHSLEPHAPVPHQLWQLDLEGRIAQREDEPERALTLFAELHELALETSSADGRLRAALGMAQSREAGGDRSEALKILREAEVLLDEQSSRFLSKGGTCSWLHAMPS